MAALVRVRVRAPRYGIINDNNRVHIYFRCTIRLHAAYAHNNPYNWFAKGVRVILHKFIIKIVSSVKLENINCIKKFLMLTLTRALGDFTVDSTDSELMSD